MDIGPAVEAEDVLPGIADKEHLHGRIYLEKQVEDPVVKLGQILSLIDDEDGHFVPEPVLETIIPKLVNEGGEDIINGDNVVPALKFGNKALQFGLPGLEP